MLFAVEVVFAGVFAVGLTAITGVLVEAELPVFAVVWLLPVPVELTGVLVEVLLAVLVEVLAVVAAGFAELFWLEVFAGEGVLEEPALVEADCLPEVVV